MLFVQKLKHMKFYEMFFFGGGGHLMVHMKKYV